MHSRRGPRYVAFGVGPAPWAGSIRPIQRLRDRESRQPRKEPMAIDKQIRDPHADDLLTPENSAVIFAGILFEVGEPDA